MRPVAHLEAMAAGEAFWRFSLALYARPGVAAALITLQDRTGRNVNLMLYALWLGARGIQLDAAHLDAAAAAMAPLDAAVVAPLRRLRRRLKSTDDPHLATLRRRILGLELAGERRVQYRLAAELPAPAGPEHGVDPPEFAAANLALYLGGVERAPETAVLLQALRGLTRR